MKTSTFIERVARGLEPQPRGGYKMVSSVRYDGERLYSYGPHYPLLFKVGTYWVCNDRGYSNTTARHISYARQNADFCVELPRYETNTDPATIKAAALSEIEEHKETIAEMLERQVKRPRYEESYQRKIGEAEDRIQKLRDLVIAADAALIK